MCVLSDCVVRIETGLCVIRFHYVAYVPEMLLSIWLLWSGSRDHSAWATGVSCRGHWPLGTSSAQVTVYRLRHRCPTARMAASQTNSWRYDDLLSGFLMYCGEMVRPSEKLSEGANRKPGSRSWFVGRRRISTSGFAYTATKTAVSPLYIVLLGTLKVNIFR